VSIEPHTVDVHPWQTRLVHAVAGALGLYCLIFNGEDKPIATDASYLKRELLAAVVTLIATIWRMVIVWRVGW
jgi:hypothetical protein